MQRKVEHIGADFGAAVEVDLGAYHLVAYRCRLCKHLACRGHDHAAADQVATFLPAGLGHRNGPKAILVASSLNGQFIVKILQVIVFWGRRIVQRRIVAQND